MIVVLADDFSGAAEIAGTAHRHGLSAEVQTEFTPASVDCVVVDANTRSLAPSEAASRTAEIVREIRDARPAFIYKKVDSVLRGPILAEAKSTASVLAKQRVLIANANPSRRRTVENGCLRIDGVPVDRTHFAMDPEHPRYSCEASALLGMEVHTGVPIEVADAREQADLDSLVAQISRGTLLCGAADFFASLLRIHFGLQPQRPLADFAQAGQTLVVCGSTAGSLHEADSRLVQRIIDLADWRCSTNRIRDSLLECGRVGLYWSHRRSSPDGEISSMAGIVRELVLENEIDHLMVEGGRSASTIARRCGWKRLAVSDAFADGVVGLKADGGESVELVVKPGSYAWPRIQPSSDQSRPLGKLRSPNGVAATATKLAVLLCWLISGFPASGLLASDFDDFVLPIIENHCTDCHGMPDEFPEGDFSMAKYNNRESVLASRRDWKNVLDVVEGHEMPPQDAEDLSEDDRRRLLNWIRGALAEPEINGQVIPGKPVLRRLTRLEYNNTVRDLLGLETDVFMFSERLPFNKDYFDPASGKMPDQLQINAREYGAKYPVLLPDTGLPGDTRGEHGFTNRGDAQNLTAVRLDGYVALAEQIAFHPELLSRAEKLQEIFPGAKFRSLPQWSPPSPKANQIVTSSGKLAPNDNVPRTGDGSDFTLEEFRNRLAVAFNEDRGGVYDVSENANTTIAGKGGVLHLAYGKNANRSFGVNPSEDIWNAAFATAEESSGGVLFTNKVKNQKEFFFGFQRSGGQEFKGIAEIGVVALSRRGQSGVIRVSVEFERGKSKTIELQLREGAGADNVFVSLSAPAGKSIRRLRVDGRDFSGDYVLLDDLAFITRDAPSKRADFVGRETPSIAVLSASPTQKEPQLSQSERRPSIDRTIAQAAPRKRLQHLMRRAFRRPVEDSEVDLYLRLYHGARTSGADDELAMRSAIHGVLSSPSFLYLFTRGEPDADSSIGSLTDHEIASRLSYFLWSSMPDGELLSLADRGQLNDPKEIEKQVRRMLKAPRVRELSENFFVEWLHLRELWSAQPDAKKFRAFYEGPKGKRTLAGDMFCEPLLLFETILTEDRSILDLIDSDFTYVNDRLAEHYGIDATVASDRAWQRVELRGRSQAEVIRGGVLTTGAVMTLTSFPHRTSPIRRGAWVLEAVFNRPPPPPKIAVADIDEQENVEHLTLREIVELHRANPACAVCHDRIDPSGFAFENFDAIGRWREQDGDEPIDPSGSLRGIGSFSSSTELKRHLSDEKDRFVRGFVEHLLSYALARELEYYDQAAIDTITKAAADDDYRLSRIIVGIATSHPFRNVVHEEQ